MEAISLQLFNYMELQDLLKSSDNELLNIAEILISSDDSIFFNKEESKYLITCLKNYNVDLLSTVMCRMDKEVLDTIEELDLSNSELNYIPNIIFTLSNLKFLNLSNNNISIIPEGISKLYKLQFLDISKNNITDFPYHLPKKISKLHIYKNNIKTLNRNKMSKFLHLFEHKFDFDKISYI